MFRVASNQFGYPMFFCPENAGCCVSDAEADAHVYDSQDSREIKLAFWKGYAKSQGLDASLVQIIEA